MNITVLGCGNIGGTIGKKWAAAGHTVIFGVRRPDDAETKSQVASYGPHASLTTIAQAIPQAPVVLFAIPGSEVDALLRLWMALVRGQGLGGGVAFKMLRR